DRHAKRLRQPGGAGPNGARQGSVLGPCVLLPRAPRRSLEAVVVGWRRVVPVRQTAGARPLRMAARRAGRGGAHTGAVVDAAGGDRLEAAGADGPAGAGRLSATK